MARDEERTGVRSPIRVTHVVFDFNGGGLESLVAQMATRFAGTPVIVSLVTLSGRVGRLGELTRHHFDQFHVVQPRRGLSMFLPVSVARAIRATRPNVVHVHNGSWYKGARAARLAGVARVIYTEHGREHDDPPIKRWIDRRAARQTDAVVAVSRRLEQYLAADVGIPRRKLVTIHNGVDTDAFAPGRASDDVRASLGLPANALVIGSVGRLEAVKAYENLLKAVPALRQTLARPFVVVLFGEGSQRPVLESLADRLGIRDVVRMPGWTTTATDAHRLFDIFVLPSRSEGQSVSLMEAMSCGVAPVVTDVGANAEMLGPELAEFVVPPDRPDALATAIATLAEPGPRLERIRSDVRRRAVDGYGLAAMTSEYERLYRGEEPRR